MTNKKIDNTLKTVFKSGSKTYFNSSIFFPKDVRRDVFVLYNFVRIPDDMADKVPQNKLGLTNYIKEFEKAYSSGYSKNETIQEFIYLMKKRDIKKIWVNDFFKAIKMDTSKHVYKTITETRNYMFGSAEVIGLMMAKILGLPEKSFHYAKLLGRSMQYINFIRDIEEDTMLKRQYIPSSSLIKFGLINLSKQTALKKPEEFKQLIRFEIQRYLMWQKEAEKGFTFIPKRYLVPIKTASDMYKWTAQQIYSDPSLIFQKKVKPGKIRIFTHILKNTLM